MRSDSPSSLEDVERALSGWISSRPKLVAHEQNALADIWRDIRSVAAAWGVSERGDQAVEMFQARMSALSCKAGQGSGAREWPKLRAVQSGQVYLADGNQFMNRPGPRIVESLQILAEILHPEVFEPKLKEPAWQALF